MDTNILQTNKSLLDILFRDKNLHFLIGGLSFVVMLTFIKAQSSPTHSIKGEIALNTNNIQQLTSTLHLNSTIHTALDHQFALTLSPITVGEYFQFVKATRYRTLREQQGLSSTWRDGNSNDAALWLSRSDAETFCEWLSHGTDKQQFRLPTTKELATAEVQSSKNNDWTWTSQDLSVFDNTLNNANEYLTAWKNPDKLRHRRYDDILSSDHEPATFFVAWTVR
jgi:formylglycine-generating enzyme required for sulfatase activity